MKISTLSRRVVISAALFFVIVSDQIYGGETDNNEMMSPFEQIDLIQDPALRRLLKSTAETLKEAGHKTFYGFRTQKPDQVWNRGYQATLLSRYCSEIYGKKLTGEIPPLITSGRSQPLTLRGKFTQITKNCSDPHLLTELMVLYWYQTGEQVENFLNRIIRLALKRPVIFYDEDAQNKAGTPYTERAIRSDGDLNAISTAIRQDTAVIIYRIFGNIEKILQSALSQTKLPK